MAQFIQINVAAAGTLNNGAFLVQVDQIENIVQTASTTTVITLTDATTFTLTHTASSPATTPTMKDAIVEAIVANPGSPFIAKVAGPVISDITVS